MTDLNTQLYEGKDFFKDCVDLLEDNEKGSFSNYLTQILSFHRCDYSNFFKVNVRPFVYIQSAINDELKGFMPLSDYYEGFPLYYPLYDKKHFIMINDGVYHLYLFKHYVDIGYEELPLLNKLLPREPWIKEEILGEPDRVPKTYYRIHANIVKFLILYNLLAKRPFLDRFEDILIDYLRLKNWT